MRARLIIIIIIVRIMWSILRAGNENAKARVPALQCVSLSLRFSAYHMIITICVCGHCSVRVEVGKRANVVGRPCARMRDK